MRWSGRRGHRSRGKTATAPAERALSTLAHDAYTEVVVGFVYINPLGAQEGTQHIFS